MLPVSLWVVAACIAKTWASDGFLIRGIPLERAVLYDPAKDFVCLDQSGKVPFAYVNDDYCDCEDGSDEPGTAACPNGTFFCANPGHEPLVIPASRVNDGICDCCDTSDEYQEGSSCVNTCSLLGEAAREQYVKTMQEHEAGYKNRLNLIAEANAKRNELETKSNELKALKEKAEEEVRAKETLKKEIEERENAALAVYREKEDAERAKKAEEEKAQREIEMKAVWDKLDIDTDGQISLTEIQVDMRFDQNKDGVVSPEEARFFVLNQDSMTWEDFTRTGWILMRPYVSGENPMFSAPEPETATEEPTETERVDEEAKDIEDVSEEKGEEIHDDYEDELPDDTPDPVVANRSYDEETQLLVDEAEKARREYNEADKSLRDLEHEMNSITATLEKDFGPDDVFLPLEDQCMEYSDREYNYKLCWFGQATQSPRHGGGSTKLGGWKGWVGPESNPYEKMLFDNGVGCWNGPNRSAHVNLSCGKENRITSASEPSRCVYHFDVETPALCANPPSLPENGSHQQWHEEL